MANSIYPAVSLIGGAAGSLDNIDGDGLANGDGAIVITSAGSYIYRLDSTSGAAESSPDIISPDANAGDKRWILTSMQSIPTQPFDVHVYVPGVLTDAMEILSTPLARAVTFPASFTGSYATGVAATAETVLTISKNGSSIGTITFAISGTTGTFAGAGGSFAAGDILSIDGPATADASLADVGLVLAGTR